MLEHTAAAPAGAPRFDHRGNRRPRLGDFQKAWNRACIAIGYRGPDPASLGECTSPSKGSDTKWSCGVEPWGRCPPMASVVSYRLSYGWCPRRPLASRKSLEERV